MQLDFTENEFWESYNKILKSITSEYVPQEKQGVIFLGGQPGSGKSYFYTQDDSLRNYVFINGDKYRKYHPHFQEIIQYDLMNMALFTQHFSNRCVEQLIKDLSDNGYNLIIEGTLRNPEIPISTCKMLKSKGYDTSLYVMAVDARVSWESTVNRAKMIQEMGETPRFVPLDKYNYIVNHIVPNLEQIEQEQCFDSIKVVDRESKILFPNGEHNSAASTLADVLQADKWNLEYKDKLLEFNLIAEEMNGQRSIKHGR